MLVPAANPNTDALSYERIATAQEPNQSSVVEYVKNKLLEKASSAFDTIAPHATTRRYVLQTYVKPVAIVGGAIGAVVGVTYGVGAATLPLLPKDPLAQGGFLRVAGTCFMGLAEIVLGTGGTVIASYGGYKGVRCCKQSYHECQQHHADWKTAEQAVIETEAATEMQSVSTETQ